MIIAFQSVCFDKSNKLKILNFLIRIKTTKIEVKLEFYNLGVDPKSHQDQYWVTSKLLAVAKSRSRLGLNRETKYGKSISHSSCAAGHLFSGFGI